MSTKAFTSALGYGITVRGYIDEDDRLVLLEPEGGGGSGGIEEAKLTITVTSTPPALVDGTIAICKITNDGNEYLGLTEISSAGEHTIAVPQKMQLMYDPEAQDIQVSGDAVAEKIPTEGYSEIYITGDAAIAVTGK